MSKITNAYRYVITNRLGLYEVQPLRESEFVIEWERQEDVELDYSRNIPSKITLVRNPYDIVLKLETSIYRCETNFISVQRNCQVSGVDTWQDWFNGSFSLNNAVWDLDRCTVDLKLDDVSPSKCINDHKSDTIDLFQIVPTRYVIKTNAPNIVIFKINASQTGPNDGSVLVPRQAWNPSAGYGPFSMSQGFIAYKNNFNSSGATFNVYTSYARQELTINCTDPAPSPEWILIADNCGTLGTKVYAKPANVYDCQYTYPADELDTSEIMDCKILGDASQITQLKNGMYLGDVLQAMVSKFCPGKTVVSNFFQINPEVLSPLNPITGLKTKTNRIFVFQKSDVKRPTANPATKAETTFEKFIAALTLMYNCKWRVTGNQFRIEHISYFGLSIGLNLTTGIYAKYSNQMRRYSYETQKIPQSEVFQFMESSRGTDFEGRPIFYTNGCVSKESQDIVKNYSTEIVTTDVQLCISNSDSESPIVQDDGLVFIAADSNGAVYWILSEDGILGDQMLNNTMAWAQLHRDYHKYNRPLGSGLMNDIETTFLSVKPTKKGAAIEVPLCCGTEFRPDDRIITPLGTGVVSKATYSFKKETINLELLYDADAGLVNNIPPVANNDVKKLYKNQTVVINVLANDVDPEGIITAVEIVNMPMHGTLLVLLDKTIQYTPALNYVGDDYFNYRIYDAWNEPSNIAIVSIVVFNTNTAPIAVDDFYSMAMGDTLTVPAPGVLINDSDDIGLTISTYNATTTAGGSVILNSNGSFVYHPITTGYYGNDTFTYTIIDDQLLTDTATVHINVINPSFPITVNDHYQTTKNINFSPGAPGVLANDINPVGGSFTASAGTGLPSGGIVTVASSGNFTYIPTTGYTGNDSFEYIATNSAGSTSGLVYMDVLPNIWVRLDKINDNTLTVTNICNGINTPGGTRKVADFRLSFFSDAGATMPIDITGLHFRIFIKKGTKSSPGGSFTYVVYELDEVSGTTFNIETGYQYYLNSHDCDSNPLFYNENTFAVDGGLYTVI